MMSVEAVQEKLDKLRETLKDARRLTILAHDNPDPDSISCAVTLAEIVSQVFGVPASARFNGIIGRAENRELIRALRLKIRSLSKKEAKSGGPVALVDCQPGTGNVTLPRNAEVLLVIDHHPLRG